MKAFTAWKELEASRDRMRQECIKAGVTDESVIDEILTFAWDNASTVHDASIALECFEDTVTGQYLDDPAYGYV